MPKKPDKKPSKKQVATFRHDEASRKNIPTAEFQSVMAKEDQSPVQVAYQRRNRDLDPQLVGAVRTRRTGRTSSSPRRRSSSRKRCTRRC